MFRQILSDIHRRQTGGDVRRHVTMVEEGMRASWIRVVCSADCVAVSGLLVFVGALVALTWRTWGDFGGDNGYDLLGGTRLANGELPYRDYVYYYGPLAPALLALFFRIGSAGIDSAVALGLALAVSATLMTYALARNLLQPIGAFLAAAIAVPVALGPQQFNFVQPHTYSAPTGVCAALGLMLGVARYASTSNPRWLALAGICTGLATLTRPELTMGTMAGAAIWLVLRVWSGIGSWRETAIFAGPAIAIPVSIYGGFMTVVSPQRLLFENLYPVNTLKAAGSVILKSNAPLTFASFVDIGWKAVLYAAGTLMMLVLASAMARQGNLRRLALVTMVAIGILVAALSFHRPETVRYALKFVYGWIPVGAVLAVLVQFWRFRRRTGPWSVSAQVALVGSIVLGVIAVKTYAVFYMYAHLVQVSAYAVPFAAIFLVRLHLVELPRIGYVLGVVWLAFLATAGAGLTWKDARSESELVLGRGGAMYVRPGDGAVYNAAVSWIEARTLPKEPILVGPQLTTLYVLTDRRNPLPHLSLLPGALPTVADERAAIARLEAAGVRLAIIDRHDFSIYGHSTFGVSFQRILAGWLREKFDHAATLSDQSSGSPTLDVWLRRGL